MCVWWTEHQQPRPKTEHTNIWRKKKFSLSILYYIATPCAIPMQAKASAAAAAAVPTTATYYIVCSSGDGRIRYENRIDRIYEQAMRRENKKEKSSDDDWWSWLWCYDCCLLSSVKWLCFCCAFGHCGATHARMPHTSQTLLDTIKHIYWFSLWKMFSACFVAPSLSHSCYPCVAASAAAAETAGDGQTFVCLLCVRFHNSRMNVR